MKTLWPTDETTIAPEQNTPIPISADNIKRLARNEYMKLYMRKYRTNKKLVKLTSDIYPIKQVEA